jgi:hypothetical protein
MRWMALVAVTACLAVVGCGGSGGSENAAAETTVETAEGGAPSCKEVANAIVGSVTGGLDIVELIGSLGDESESPTQTVLIERVTVGP